MKNLILSTLIASMFFACKKDAANINISDKLVRSLWARNHKLDSSGRFYTTIDSFVFDNRNRISKIISSSFDTLFSNNIPYPKMDSFTTYISYAGSSSLPEKIYSPSGLNIIFYNNAGQVLKDSIPPDHVTTYSYSSGLIVAFFGSLNYFYNIDSISIDANNNVVFQLIGGNYFLDNNNNSIYGKINSSKYSYSNILNPIYTNTSLSTVLFLLKNNLPSKYLPSELEWIAYGKNGTIFLDQTSHYQINVDANNHVQSTIDLVHGDITKWAYY